MLGSWATAMAQLDAALDAVAALEPGSGQLAALMQRRNRMEAITTRCVRKADREGVSHGATSTATWLAWRCRIPKSRAKRLVSNGAALDDMPEVAAAFDRGDVCDDHVRVLAAAQRFAPHAFPKAEPELVDDALRLHYVAFTRFVKYFEQLAEPDAVEDRAAKLVDDRQLHASRTFEDAIAVDGVFEPLGGTIWLNELKRLEQLEFEADWREARQRLGEHATAHDLRRTPAQRRHDAQVEMAARSAAMPADAKRARVLLTVHVGYETLFGRICELADGTVVTPGQVVPLLTHAEVERAVFGAEGRVTDLGRRSRLFVGGARRAVEVRDLECTHPTCDVRYERCDVDHTVPWAAGRPTDQANGRLRCPHHNPGRRRAPP